MLLAIRSPRALCQNEQSYLSLEGGAHYPVNEVPERPISPATFGTGAPLLPQLPPELAALSNKLKLAFRQERELTGRPIDYQQAPDSFNRLDASVRALFSEYFAGGSAKAHQQFVLFNQHHYVRHLLDASEDFELMVICWQPGQKSRVHNHGTSHCWLTCVEGSVEERQYAIPACHGQAVAATDTSALPCPQLELTSTLCLQRGETGYINDNTCLHSVGCHASTPAPGAVTIHLYAPPIRRVRLYEPEENKITSRVPGFFTVRGLRMASEAGNAAPPAPPPKPAEALCDGAGI